MNELQVTRNTGISEYEGYTDNTAITEQNRLEIIEEVIRKKYLSRLNEMRIAPIGDNGVNPRKWVDAFLLGRQI